MRQFTRQYAIALALTLAAAFVGTALPALAADEGSPYAFSDFAIPNPNRGDTSRLLLTIDTSAHNGETCTVRVSTANGPSVHPENYVTLQGGIPTVVVNGTEDAANGTHQNTTTVVAGDTLEVWNHFGLATSVDGEVSIECSTPTSSTSTVPTTSTTFSQTTTTSDTPTTTTTSETTTSSSSTSTTTVPTDSTTTVPPVTTTPDQGTLPFTGPEDLAGVAMAGAALLLLGGGLALAARGES